MQKKQKNAPEKDELLNIVETAMAEELKARDFYKKISRQLKDKAAKLKFEVMSDTEQRHFELLKKWYEGQFGKIPKTKKTMAVKAVKVNVPTKNATYEDIIKIIINTEERAYKYYKTAARNTKDIKAKELFKKLSDIELAHTDQFKDEYRIITEPSLRCAEEDIPWMMEV